MSSAGDGDGDGDGGGRRGPSDQEPTETYRPSLFKLTLDVRETREELLAGFPSRADVLRWEQRLAVRTLGEVPMHFYEELARQFRFSESPVVEPEPAIRVVGPDVDEQLAELADAIGAVSDRRDVCAGSARHAASPGDRGGRARRRQGTLLAALLQEGARDRELPSDAVTELRERLVATYVNPAYHRAFRQLRKSAGEYIKETSDDAGHDPRRQKHIAMRPALDELDDYQSRALGKVLGGIESRGALLEWIEEVELATHGEVPAGFGERCYKEPSAVALLTSPDRERQAAREIFAAFHLIPAFNRGVRDLVGRAGELPETAQERTEPKAV